MRQPLAIIGAGNMAEAIARALLKSAVIPAEQMVAADPAELRRQLFQRELGIRTVPSPAEAVAGAAIVLLAVKPQQMEVVLREIAGAIRRDALVISIAAGVSIATIESKLGAPPCPVVRTMPNTPLLVGEGMVAIAPGTRATAQELADARTLFAPAATVIEVSEDKLDAVTAISGSGPAYIFYLVEQMIRAGEEMGLGADEARTLAIRTAVGSAKMLQSIDVPADELRRRVTSPGGTTEAAIAHLEHHRFDRILIDAMKAAQRRGRELGASHAPVPSGRVS